MSVLAYTPFIDPLNIHRFWFLLIIPMGLFISLAYKSVRLPDLRDLPKQVLVMTVQITLGMIALGAAAYLLVQFIIPMVAPK